MFSKRIQEKALPYVISAVQVLSSFPAVKEVRVFGSSLEGGGGSLKDRMEWSGYHSDVDLYVLVTGEEYSCFAGSYVETAGGRKYREAESRIRMRRAVSRECPRASLQIIEEGDLPELYWNGIVELLHGVNFNFPPPSALRKMRRGKKVYDRRRGVLV